MSSLVTRQAPDFTATVVMPDDRLDEGFSLAGLRGRYVLLFFYPLDFTFVCPSEILAFDKALQEFEDRDCQVVGVSVDSPYSHLAWKRTPPEQGGIGPIRFPLVSDLNKEIARRYGVLLEDGMALRALFLIDRGGIVRHSLVNDLVLGRSVKEALRSLDALRFHEQHGNVCPAEWNRGDEGMKPSQKGVVDYLSKFARARG